MSTDHNFASRTTTDLPLSLWVRREARRFSSEPAGFLSPLIECLASIHQEKNFHGAVIPSNLFASATGEINLAYFTAQAGLTDSEEAKIYYPEGLGTDLESRQHQDLRALAAVMHFLISGHAPVNQDRERARLADDLSYLNWPKEFLAWVDQILTDEQISEFSTIQQLACSLIALKPSNENAPAQSKDEDTRQGKLGGMIQVLSACRLPNAMVGREFSCSLDRVVDAHSLLLSSIELAGDAPAGLDFQNERLMGVPAQSGEFVLIFRGMSDSGVSWQCSVSLTVNPDPRSLWKNAPSDHTGIFWRPDEAIAFLKKAPITVFGASLRGRSHAHVGGYRDDDMALGWFPETSWYALVVADGAGSAKFSRQGAKIACDTVMSRFSEYFAKADNPLTQLVTHPANEVSSAVRQELYALFGGAALDARNAIDSEAAAIQATTRDFHTTLVTALVHPLADGRWFIATFSIGDGAAAVISVAGQHPCLLTRPDGGEYAGQTVFLTMNEVFSDREALMGRIQTVVLSDFEALMLVTDGISDPRFQSDVELADPQAWAHLWLELKNVVETAASPQHAASAVLKWMDFHSPGHHDDRTLVLVTPHFLNSRP